jgi:hypothetical protein
MSATLGLGGELERLTGRHAIKRLPIEAGWEKRGTGRRLILFPDLFVDDNAGREAIGEVMHAPTPTLVLVPENRLVERIRSTMT